MKEGGSWGAGEGFVGGGGEGMRLRCPGGLIHLSQGRTLALVDSTETNH